MIRIAKFEAVHVFFIKPDNISQEINYSNDTNLFHNKYNKQDIELFLTNNPKVSRWEWYDNNKSECTLHVYIKLNNSSIV